MTVLTKSFIIETIPGSPSSPGVTGSPAIPAYCSTVIEYINRSYVYVLYNVDDDDIGDVYGEDRPGVTFGGGYDDWGYWTWIAEREESVTTCYDAVDAVVGVPSDPGTPEQISYYYNDGWNAHSTSYSSIDNAEIFSYTVQVGTVGGFLCIGPPGMEGRTLGSFSHSLLVDMNGLYVYENGVQVSTLSSSNIGYAEVKISRYADNTVDYALGDVVYTSTIDFPLAAGLPGKVYGFLYSSGDSLLTASLTDVAVPVFGSASLESTSTFSAHDIRAGSSLSASSTLSAHDIRAGAVLIATSELSAVSASRASLTASSAMYASSSIGLQCNTTLGALNGSSGESPFMDQRTIDLGALTGTITEGTIIPATPLRAQGNLPTIVGSSLVVGARLNAFDGDLKIPKPKVNASFGMFGDIDIPKPVVSGVFISATTIHGVLNVPTPRVAGTLEVTSLFAGALDIPTPIVLGTLITGNLLSGNIDVPKVRVLGTFTTDDDFAGALDIPLVKVSGTILSAADDSAWTYSGSTACQQ